MSLARIGVTANPAVRWRLTQRSLSTLPPSNTNAEFKITPPKSYSDNGANDNNSSSGDGGAPPPRGGFPFKSLTALVLATAGGVLFGCHYSPDMRQYVEKNVPYSKEVLDPAMRGIDSTTHYVTDWLHNMRKPSPPAQKASPPSRESPAPLFPYISPPTPPTTVKSAIEPPKERDRSAEVNAEVKRQERVKHLKNEDLSRQLDSLVRQAQGLTKTAIKDLNALESQTRSHAQALQKAIETETTEDERSKLWSVVFDVSNLKNDRKSTANSSVAHAQGVLQELKEVVQQGLNSVETKSNAALPEAQKTLTQLQYELSTAVTATHKAESDFSMVSKYKDLVASSRASFEKELQNILPEVDVKNKSGQLTREELNALLVHAHRRIDQLMKHLAEKEALDKARLSAALEQQKHEDERLAQEMLERELERERNNMILAKRDWETEFRKSVEDEIRQALAVQAAAHNDHLRDVLRVQMEALNAAHELDLRQHLLKEREKFYASLKTWISRVRAIEDAIEGRAEAEEEARTAQELWLATQALLNATEGVDFLVEMKSSLPPWASRSVAMVRNSDTRLPLKALLHVVANMAEKANAKFIQQLVKEVPKSAVEEGVYNAEHLARRFRKVKRICRRVSMLNESGASIPMFLLSWLQSVFVLERSRALGPEDEVVLLSGTGLESPVDHQTATVVSLDRERQLDTFTLLSSAERALASDNLELAVRFMGQLRGAPAVVAHDWLQEARLLLETRQVVRAMRAAASARGIAGVELPDGSMVAPERGTTLKGIVSAVGSAQTA